MTPPAKARCPQCGQDIRIRNDGRLQRHDATTIHVSPAAIKTVGAGSKTIRCPGSGKVVRSISRPPSADEDIPRQPTLPDVDHRKGDRGVTKIDTKGKT